MLQQLTKKGASELNGVFRAVFEAIDGKQKNPRLAEGDSTTKSDAVIQIHGPTYLIF
jgi:hypothetical protein